MTRNLLLLGLLVALLGSTIYNCAPQEGKIRKKRIAELVKQLDDKDWQVRKAAIQSLKELKAKEAVAEITKKLKDNDERVRQAAIETLGQLSVLEITKQIDNDDRKFRCVALYAIAALEDKQAIPNVIKCLEDNDADIRRTAIYVLRKLNAKESIPKIIEKLKDNDEYVRRAAQQVLKDWNINQFEDEDAQLQKQIDELISNLGHKNEKVREEAIKSLIEIGKPAEKSLKKALKLDDPKVQEEAKIILQEISLPIQVQINLFQSKNITIIQIEGNQFTNYDELKRFLSDYSTKVRRTREIEAVINTKKNVPLQDVIDCLNTVRGLRINAKFGRQE